MSTQDELGRTLREHADGIDGPASGRPLTLGDVRGRARRIRRRRAAGVAAGAGLVAAVVLPLAILGGTGTDRSEPSPAPSPTRAVDPFGGGVPTLQDGVIIYPDGPRIPLQGDLRDTADGFAVLGTDRYFVTRSAGAGREGVLVDDHGAPLGRFDLYAGLTVGPDASSIAWVDPDRTVQLLLAGSDEPRTIVDDDPGVTTTEAITGDCADSCTIAVRTERGGDLGGTVMVTYQGQVTTTEVNEQPAVPAVIDISPDGSLIAGADSVADDDIHVCGGVYDVGVGDFLWRGCEDNSFDFSPDGALVATSFGEGLGPIGVTLRDARTGASVAELTGQRVASYVWEDATHLLAVIVADDGATSVQRIGTDGPPEIVLEGFTTGPDEVSPPITLPLA